MASIIKANQLQDFGGNSILTSDGAGVVTPNASGIKMTPAFEATLSANQGISDATDTKVQFDTETFDTDGCYDNSSNYRFTPTTAGKYYVYARVQSDAQASANFSQGIIKIYKNGSRVAQSQMNMNGNPPENIMIPVFNIVDMNGSSDYLEIYAYIDDTSSTPTVRGSSSYAWTSFGAYKVIGA